MTNLPKFTLGIDKMKSADAGRASGHNCRLHKTMSQLPKQAWFTPEGRHEIMAWRPAVLARARKLSKRKDAVVAVSFVFQVGDQAHWRHPPSSEEDLHGEPKLKGQEFMDEAMKVAQGAKEWAIREFGEANIVGIDLHTDESSPHVHVVVTPVNDNALQAKHWLDGKKRCAQLRKRAWEPVNALIPCFYTEGAAGGGAPHDERLAAGKGKQVLKRLEIRDVALKADEFSVLNRELELDEQESAMADREADVGLRELELEAWKKGLDERKKALDERERVMQIDRTALEQRALEVEGNSTLEGIRSARNEARERNVLLQDTLRSLIKNLTDGEVALFAKGLKSPDQRKIVQAIMDGQGRGLSGISYDYEGPTPR